MKGRSTARAGASISASPRFPTRDSYALAAAPLAAAAAAIALLVYLPALGNGFVWDDPLVLEQLRAIRTWGDLLIVPSQFPHHYYRPVIFLTYLVDRAIGGETPFWFHASVVGFHVVNCVLVFRLATLLFRPDLTIAISSALLFAVFPTHVESVAWMAGRSDVIACTFLLLTLLLSTRRHATWTLWTSGITMFLALLSKESAIAGLIVVPAFDWLRSRRLYLRSYVPLLLATIAYFALRQRNVGALIGGAPVSVVPGEIAFELVRALGFYLLHSIAPVQLCGYVASIPQNGIYLAAGLLLPLIGVVTLYRRWPLSRWPLMFLLVWFGITLAPSFTVIVRRSASAPVADRYLYVPSVASCILLAWAIVWVMESRHLSARWSLGLIAVLATGLGISTAMYTKVWADNLTFWSDVAAKQPQNVLARRELGSALLERGHLGEAQALLEQALILSAEPTDRAMAHSQLGIIYRRKRQFANAIRAYQSALNTAPHPALYHNLGMTLMAKAEQDQRDGDTDAVLNDVRQARTAFEAALTFGDDRRGEILMEQWDAAKTHALLGQVLISLGDRVGAREHLQTALELQPTGPIADATRRQLAKLAP